ncbi:hypothetical protein D9M69_518450 [compost metagenome]
MQAIQPVVPADQQQRQADQHCAWQPEQRGKRQHAEADGPDHLQVDDTGWKLEGPGEIHQGDFERHQEQAAFEQEARHRRPPLLFLFVEKSRQAGQQDEHRRAQVRQGTVEEEQGFRLQDVHRVRHLPMQVEGLAHVVQQHEQDHQPTQGIDGVKAVRGGCGHWARH